MVNESTTRESTTRASSALQYSAVERSNITDELKKFITESESRLVGTINALSAKLDATQATLDETQAQLSRVTRENIELKNELRELRARYDHVEQYTRRQNVRVNGITFAKGDTEATLKPKILKVLNEGGMKTKASDFNRFHYTAKPVTKEGVTMRQVIVQLNNWDAREELHQFNRKNRASSFRVNADLTQERYKLLNMARDLIKEKLLLKYSEEEIKHLPDTENVFAYANVNSMLKIRARGEVLQLRDEDELILHVEQLFAGFGDF